MLKQNYVVLENNILYPLKVTQVEQYVKYNTNEGFDLDHLKRKATKEGNISQKKLSIFWIPRTNLILEKFDVITNKG
jgi:hypothetical protein